MKKVKCLFFVMSNVGGAERMSINIAKMLDKSRYEVEFVVVKRGEKTSLITDFIPSSFMYYELSWRNLLYAFVNLYIMLKKHEPLLVFSSLYTLNNKLLLLKMFFPSINFIIRADNYLYTYPFHAKLIIKFLYRFSNMIIVQTDEMKNEYLNSKVIKNSKIVTLENPVDKEGIDNKIVNAINPFPDNGRKNIVAVGRFAYQKGFDLLVYAMKEILYQREDVDLYIVGAKNGEWYSEYMKILNLVTDMGINEHVFFVGFKTNPYPYIKYADCFVLSSRWEGMPNVLGEALYLGTPVAAFKCIPIVERMVQDGIDGFLVEKDNYRKLAESIINAFSLGRIKRKCCGSSKDDFVKVFDYVSGL